MSARLPDPVARALGLLPKWPGSWLFARGLTLVLGPQLPGDVKTALSGRPLRLLVLDAGLQFDFLWRQDRFQPVVPRTPDLTIGASLADLARLARREEDPDTLFFQRRLLLEGDTALGLLFKNTLDALDLSRLRPW